MRAATKTWGAYGSLGVARTIPDEQMDWSRFDNHRRVQVVGAQYHQPALLTASERLIVQHTDRCLTEAELLREPDNPHDPSAVQVLVKGQRIGYLKAGSARRFNKRIRALEEEGKRPSYPVLIRMAKPGFFQAHLQIPYSSELLADYKNPKQPKR
jgi:hypothetical protein